MTIYKAILYLLNRNKVTLLFGLVVMGVITVFYTGQLASDSEEANQVSIVIFDQDNSEISRSLVNQLTKQYTRITLEDTSQKGIDDALYFDKAEAILTIPKNFGEDLKNGQEAKIDSQSKPGTFSKALLTMTINNFLNTYQTYNVQLSTLSQQQILTRTEETVSQTGTLRFDTSYQQKKRQTLTANVYNLLSYGLFMTLFSGYAVIYLAFNRKEIYNRNRCAPVTRHKLSQRITIGCLGYALTCLAIFTAFVFFTTGSTLNQVTGYFFLNVFLFFIAMISFSILFSSFVKNSETISGINNVLILGSCFISGVFIPLDMLPEVVTKIASFTPSYWFVQNNQLIGKTTHFDQAFKETFTQQSLILLTFSVVFLLIHFIIIKEKKTPNFLSRSRLS